MLEFWLPLTGLGKPDLYFPGCKGLFFPGIRFVLDLFCMIYTGYLQNIYILYRRKIYVNFLYIG